MLKILIAVLSSLFLTGGLSLAKSHETQMLEDLKRAIRTEVFTMSLRLFLGIVLTSIALYSLFFFAEAMRVVIAQAADPIAIQLALYGALSIIAICGLYILFNTETAPAKPKVDPNQVVFPEVDWQALLVNFMQGAANGFADPDTRQKARSVHTDLHE
jgi:hypothetical protein